MLKQRNILFTIIGLLVFLSVGSVTAAEFITGEETWTLTPSQTVDDDLYIEAGEIIIEGTVNGDIVAIGEYLRIQGEVNGDILFLGGGLRLDGTVNGDIRAAALSVDIRGTVSDDLTVAGFGIVGLDDPVPIGNNRALIVGTRINEGMVGDDVYALSGLIHMNNGTIGGDVMGQVAGLDMTNSQIEGSVDLSVLQIAVDDLSRVLGTDGFRYRSAIPAEVSTLTEKIEYVAIEQPPTDWIAVLRTIVGRVAGLAIVGWIILRFRPNLLVEPVAAINARSIWATWLGLTIVGSAFFAAFGLAILVSFFWGGLAAITFAGSILFGMGTMWILSPLVTGFWLGQRFSIQPFQGLLFGCIFIVIMQMIPLFGFGISLFSFVIAVGGMALAPRIEDLPSQV